MKTSPHRKLDAQAFVFLSKKRLFPWIRDALLDWAIISTTCAAAVILNNVFFYIASLLIIGNRQHALAILGHDGTHYTISKSKKINDGITNFLAFWPIGLTSSGYRNLHFKHHKHTNTVNDPELMHRGSKAPQWDLPITLPKIIKLAAYDLLGYSLSDYIMIVMFSKPSKKISYVGLGIFHLLFCSICVATHMIEIAILWYASLATTFMMFFRLRTWLEHQGSDDTHILHLNLLERIVLSPHNAWYHYEHHHWPSVPYSQLPKLRAYTKSKEPMQLKDLLELYKQSSFIRSGKALKLENSGELKQKIPTHNDNKEQNKKIAA